MTREITKYNKDQKIAVPREVRPILERVIAEREQYSAEAFRSIAEEFGYGAKQVADKGWSFAVDHDKGVAFSFRNDSEERERIDEIPVEKAFAPIAKLESIRHANDIVVAILELVIKDANHYHWTLKPAEMEIIIHNRKEQPPINLSAVQDGGGVQ